jgi:hypothetical protein
MSGSFFVDMFLAVILFNPSISHIGSFIGLFVLKAVGYYNAGTVEFIVDTFLESPTSWR